MKKEAAKPPSKRNKKKRLNCIRKICWIIIPFAIVLLLFLDAVKLYSFTTERLIVLGIGVGVVLLPFFSEITIKNFSVKK